MTRGRSHRAWGLIGGLLLALQVSCRPGGVLPARGLTQAMMDFVMSLPDSLTDPQCRRLYVHPLVGDDWIEIAENARTPWRTIGRLPVRDGEVVRRSQKLYVFSPFRMDSLADGCIAYALHTRPSTPTDTAQVYLEVFVNRNGKWVPQVQALADAAKRGGAWAVVLREVYW